MLIDDQSAVIAALSTPDAYGFKPAHKIVVKETNISDVNCTSNATEIRGRITIECYTNILSGILFKAPGDGAVTGGSAEIDLDTARAPRDEIC